MASGADLHSRGPGFKSTTLTKNWVCDTVAVPCSNPCSLKKAKWSPSLHLEMLYTVKSCLQALISYTTSQAFIGWQEQNIVLMIQFVSLLGAILFK